MRATAPYLAGTRDATCSSSSPCAPMAGRGARSAKHFRVHCEYLYVRSALQAVYYIPGTRYCGKVIEACRLFYFVLFWWSSWNINIVRFPIFLENSRISIFLWCDIIVAVWAGWRSDMSVPGMEHTWWALLLYSWHFVNTRYIYNVPGTPYLVYNI